MRWGGVRCRLAGCADHVGWGSILSPLSFFFLFAVSASTVSYALFCLNGTHIPMPQIASNFSWWVFLCRQLSRSPLNRCVAVSLKQSKRASNSSEADKKEYRRKREPFVVNCRLASLGTGKDLLQKYYCCHPKEHGLWPDKRSTHPIKMEEVLVIWSNLHWKLACHGTPNNY